MHDEPGEAIPEGSIRAWLEDSGWTPRRLVRIAGDVSVRCYYRVELADGRSAVAAFYPPEIIVACSNYLRTSKLLASVGVPVPEILAADCSRGVMLVEDVGTETLYDLGDRDWRELAPYYSQAICYLEPIHSLSLPEVAELNPPLDERLLWRELQRTWRLLLSDLVGGDAFATRLLAALREVCGRLGADRRVVCHRDFMARNLVPRSPSPRLVVLDHQDLRPGPPFYDLASLLNDSLFPPIELEQELATPVLGGDHQRLAYHRAAAQRTLKAAGTFEGLLQQGDARHQSLIAPTVRRALYHLEQLPEARRVTHELRLRLASGSGLGAGA